MRWKKLCDCSLTMNNNGAPTQLDAIHKNLQLPGDMPTRQATTMTAIRTARTSSLYRVAMDAQQARGKNAVQTAPGQKCRIRRLGTRSARPGNKRKPAEGLTGKTLEKKQADCTWTPTEESRATYGAAYNAEASAELQPSAQESWFSKTQLNSKPGEPGII